MSYVIVAVVLVIFLAIILQARSNIHDKRANRFVIRREAARRDLKAKKSYASTYRVEYTWKVKRLRGNGIRSARGNLIITDDAIYLLPSHIMLWLFALSLVLPSYKVPRSSLLTLEMSVSPRPWWHDFSLPASKEKLVVAFADGLQCEFRTASGHANIGDIANTLRHS